MTDEDQFVLSRVWATKEQLAEYFGSGGVMNEKSLLQKISETINEDFKGEPEFSIEVRAFLDEIKDAIHTSSVYIQEQTYVCEMRLGSQLDEIRGCLTGLIERMESLEDSFEEQQIGIISCYDILSGKKKK